MSAKIRVLIVDDSQLVQEVLRSILGTDSEMEVIGAAANGREALTLTAKWRPDVVVMDINMPELDGLEATEKIMAYCPTPILILTSMDGADVAFEALSKGALEVLQKPELDDEKCRELIGKIKLSAGVRVITHIAGRQGETKVPERPAPTPPAPAKPRAPLAPARPGAGRAAASGMVIGIGSSTGGPKALGQICNALPADFPAAILVVQHIADGFVPVLTSWLDGSSQIRVKEAEDGEDLAPGVVYIAPSNVHTELVGTRIALRDGEPLAGHRPSIDVLLSSIAKSHRARGVGIILSGMGRDGARGARDIRNAGGYTMAQDEDSCVVFGMPRAAAELDGIDQVLNPLEIAGAMLRHAQEGRES